MNYYVHKFSDCKKFIVDNKDDFFFDHVNTKPFHQHCLSGNYDDKLFMILLDSSYESILRLVCAGHLEEFVADIDFVITDYRLPRRICLYADGHWGGVHHKQIKDGLAKKSDKVICSVNFDDASKLVLNYTSDTTIDEIKRNRFDYYRSEHAENFSITDVTTYCQYESDSKVYYGFDTDRTFL
jgi:hypothetical protein